MKMRQRLAMPPLPGRRPTAQHLPSSCAEGCGRMLNRSNLALSGGGEAASSSSQRSELLQTMERCLLRLSRLPPARRRPCCLTELELLCGQLSTTCGHGHKSDHQRGPCGQGGPYELWRQQSSKQKPMHRCQLCLQRHKHHHEHTACIRLTLGDCNSIVTPFAKCSGLVCLPQRKGAPKQSASVETRTKTGAGRRGRSGRR